MRRQVILSLVMITVSLVWTADYFTGLGFWAAPVKTDTARQAYGAGWLSCLTLAGGIDILLTVRRRSREAAARRASGGA